MSLETCLKETLADMLAEYSIVVSDEQLDLMADCLATSVEMYNEMGSYRPENPLISQMDEIRRKHKAEIFQMDTAHDREVKRLRDDLQYLDGVVYELKSKLVT